MLELVARPAVHQSKPISSLAKEAKVECGLLKDSTMTRPAVMTQSTDEAKIVTADMGQKDKPSSPSKSKSSPNSKKGLYPPLLSTLDFPYSTGLFGVKFIKVFANQMRT